MNNKQHRSITRDVEEINKEILKQIESLRVIQKYSSRVDTRTSTNKLNDLKNSTKILQIKPSSRGHSKYTVSELHVATSVVIPTNKYSYLQHNKSNKENMIKNQIGGNQNKLKDGDFSKKKQPSKMRTSLKTQSCYNEKGNNHQKSIVYCNPSHYVSEHIVSDNLFGDYELSDSSGSDKLFPEDSLNFDLMRQQMPRQSTSFGKKKQTNLTPKKELIHMLQAANKISQVKRRIVQRPVEYTFKPVILDRSKEIAEKMGSSHTRLTAKSKNNLRQNTYKDPPSSNKTYSRERLNTLSRPRVVTEEPQSQINQQYTFKPVLSKKSLNHFNGCQLDVIERNQLWENQRQQKLERLKKSEQQMKNQRLKTECSAVKIKNSYKPDREVKLSQFGKEGLLGYFERVTQASQIKKRQKDSEVKFSGKGWNGSVTKPQQFKLSSNSPNELSYRSKSKNTTAHNTSQNPVQKEYQKAIKQLHDKIQKLHL